MAIDKRLTGQNFCGLDCIDNQNVIHPETCVDNVVLSNDSTTTLNNWLSNNPDNPTLPLGTFTSTSGMLNWLRTYYPVSESTLEPATTESIGGVIVDNTYLTIGSDGTLGVDRTALDIPSVDAAAFSSEGVIKLGNDTVLPNNFANNAIDDNIVSFTPTGTDVYAFPLRLDSVGHAGVALPTELFSFNQSQADWNQDDSSQNDYIKNKPTLSGVATTGDYNDLTNTPTIIDYTAGDNITIESGVISATGYNDFTGTDGSTDGTHGLVPAPEAATDVNKYLKSNGTWEDPNAVFKNQRVDSVLPKVYDQYGNHFDLYNVTCNLYGDSVNIANKNDFRKTTTQYNNKIYPSNTALTKTYTWEIGSTGTNRYIGVLYGNATACKGIFKLKIKESNKTDYDIYDVGFVLDTPSDVAFAWFTDLSWEISARGGNSDLLVYLLIPDNFTGTVILEPDTLTCHLGNNVGVFYNSTSSYTSLEKHSWSSVSESSVTIPVCTSLVYTQIDYSGNHVPNPYHIYTDAFVDIDYDLVIGDVLYDSVINDYILHTLVRRVNSMQDTLNSIITRLNQLNVYTQPSN